MKVGDTVILKNWHKAKVVQLNDLEVTIKFHDGKENTVHKNDILRVETEADRRGECS